MTLPKHTAGRLDGPPRISYWTAFIPLFLLSHLFLALGLLLMAEGNRPDVFPFLWIMYAAMLAAALFTGAVTAWANVSAEMQWRREREVEEENRASICLTCRNDGRPCDWHG